MATIQDLGKVAYLNKGVYNSETTYEINDVVSFNGSSYVSKTNENRGNLPTNTIYWSIVASKGDKGETGKPFVIEKTYMTIEAMVADYDNMNINDYVMISGNIEEEQNATLWTKTANEVSPYKWEYLADFSGASGITGATPNIIIGNVTEGNQPAVTRRAGSSNENPILDFILKTGPKGDIGDTGNGISSIEKTGTSGLVDTYTITYTDGTTSTFQVTNGEDAEITPEEFEKLQNEVNELKDENQRLKATLPTTTGTGENITLNKTAEMEFVVPPLPIGNTKQNTTEGKNLLPYPWNFRSGSSFNGITITSNNDGKSFNIVGTATATTTFELLRDTNKEILLDDVSYFLQGGKSDNVRLYFNNGTMDTGSGTTYSYPKDSTATRLIGVYITSGSTVNETIYPMLNVGNTALPYEPYTNGASPNPDYPQEVQVVKGDVEVKLQNKNLLDISILTTRTIANVNITNNGDGSFTLNGTSSSNGGAVDIPINIPLKNNTTYTYSKTTKTNVAVFAIILYNSSNQTIVSLDSGSTSTSFTPQSDVVAKSFKLYFAPSKTFSNHTIYPMLEINSTATAYTPHQEQKLPLYLPVENLFDGIFAQGGLDLGGIGEATSNNARIRSDFIPVKPNTTYTVSNHNSNIYQFGMGLYKSDETYDSAHKINNGAWINFPYTFTTQSDTYYIRMAFKNSSDTAISPTGDYKIMLNEDSKANHYTPYGTTPIELCKIEDYKDKFEKNNGVWKIPNKILKIDSYNGETITTPYISSTGGLDIGATVYYVGDNALEITDTTLISQLEAIYNAISYYEQTNISGTSSGINPLFDVEAYQSTKLLLENALDRLELLEN